MRRDEDGQIVERDPANPHGLPPMITAEERATRLANLNLITETAYAAADQVEAVRLRSLRPDGPVALEEIQWWSA